MPAGWSGRPNGRIPLSMLTELRGDIGVSGYAQADAARAYQAIAAEFERAVGVPLAFSEAYRDYDRQVYLRQLYLNGRGSPAAIPGTSNHGEALAFDFAYPMTSWSTKGQAWFRQNEARFGFSSAQGIADGEPWHKVYIGPTPTVAGGGATPIPERTDDDEMITPEAQQFVRDTVQTAVDTAVATLTSRLQREARGRLYYCADPGPDLPNFVVIFWPRTPAERNAGKNVLYCNDGETQARNLRDVYYQTADTVEQAKAAAVDQRRFRMLIDFAEGTDSAFTNTRAPKN